MLFNNVCKMIKVGNSPDVRRQLIPEFTDIARKDFKPWDLTFGPLDQNKTTTFTKPGVVRVNTVL